MSPVDANQENHLCERLFDHGEKAARLGSTRTCAANTLQGWDPREGLYRSFSRNLFTWISFIASKDQNANDGITAAKAAFVSTKPSTPNNSHKLYPSSSFFFGFYILGNFYYTCCRGKEVRIFGIFRSISLCF